MASAEAGLRALCEIVRKRAGKVDVSVGEFFATDALLERLCRLSGGHVRTLFILIRSAIERCDGLPITADIVERTIRRAADDTALTLKTPEWEVLREVHQSKAPVQEEEKAELWYGLLRDLFVFSYEDDDRGTWYDWNPLLGEVKNGGRS